MRWSLLLGLLLVGCKGGFSERGERSAAEYRWLLRYDVKTLDPAAISDWTTGEVLHYLYPSIAEVCEVEASKDFRTYTLKPKSIAKATGRNLAVQDIRLTLERCLRPEVQSGLGSLFAGEIVGAKEFADKKSEHISGIKFSEDARALTIELAKPDVSFVSKLGSHALGVVDQDQVRVDRPITDWKPGYGLGRFALNSVVPGQEWVLADGKDKIRFQYFGDSAARKTHFDVDKADQAMFAAHDIGVVKGHPMLTASGPTTLVYVQFNQQKAPFDLEVNRNAVMQIIVGMQLEGRLTAILDGKVVNASSFGEVSGLKAPAVNIKQALVKPEFDMIYADIGHTNPVVEAIITELQKQGIKAHARPMTSAALISENNRGSLQALFTGWQPDFGGPLNTIPYLFHSKSPENHSGFSDPAVDKLIEAAEAGVNTKAKMEEALGKIQMNIPGVPLYIQRDLVLMRRQPPKP